MWDQNSSKAKCHARKVFPPSRIESLDTNGILFFSTQLLFDDLIFGMFGSWKYARVETSYENKFNKLRRAYTFS